MQDYPGDLRALVGSFGPVLKRYAFGEDTRALELGDEIKSISNEETFLHDTDDRKILRHCLREQAADLSERMKRRRLGAYTVQVKLRYGDFTTLTRQISVEESITEANDIYRHSRAPLLARGKVGVASVALAGIGRKQFARTQRTTTGVLVGNHTSIFGISSHNGFKSASFNAINFSSFLSPMANARLRHWRASERLPSWQS